MSLRFSPIRLALVLPVMTGLVFFLHFVECTSICLTERESPLGCFSMDDAYNLPIVFSAASVWINAFHAGRKG